MLVVMDKRPPDNHPYPDRWPAREERYANNPDLIGEIVHHRPANLVSGKVIPGKKENVSTHLLIWGLILLQIMALVAVLVILTPTESQVNNQDMVAALDVRPMLEAQPVVPEPPPPDYTQALQIPDAESILAEEPIPQAKPAFLRLRGLEITQGIQVFNEPEHPRCQPDPHHPDHIFCNNSMPLVAGRHTLARVYLACNGDCPPTEITVRLRLLKDGQEQLSLTRQLPAETLQHVNSLPLQELRLNLAHSVNFEFFPPPAWMSGQITFELEAMPSDAVEVSPATLTLSKNFAVRKPLRVAYLPIEYQGFRPPEPTQVEYWLLRMYPVPAVEYYRLPMPDLVWEGELSKGEILRKLLYTYWLYAQYHSNETWPDQLFGWLPPEFYNGGASDPFWCPNCAGLHSSRVAFGGLRPEQDIGGPRILVHEIAHNLGAQHAWSPTQREDAYCFKAEGVDIRVDPDWPYADTPHIQEFGIDLYSNPPIIYSPSFYDMMAYCTRPWISPYTYRKLFDSPFLQPKATVTLPLADFKPQAEITDGGTLLVSGIIYPDGTVSNPEVIRLEGSAFYDPAGAFNPPLKFALPPGDDYCLNVEADDNTILAQHCFDTGFLDLETGLPTESSPFLFILPRTDLNDVAKVTISRNEVALVIVTPSNSPPNVNVTFPNGSETLTGQQTITWEASDADGGSLLHDLLYSPDGGQSWLPLAVRLNRTHYTFDTSQIPASYNALIRVITTDGFHTSLDESDAPFTIEPPLENSLGLRGPATVKPGQTFEVAVVAHRVTGPGLFGVQFKLNFDPVLLQLDSLRLHPDLSLVVADSIDNDMGQVSVVASRQGQVANLTGDLTLATFTFTAASETGEVYLNLSEVMAGARGGLPLTISKIQTLSLRIAE